MFIPNKYITIYLIKFVNMRQVRSNCADTKNLNCEFISFRNWNGFDNNMLNE